jgi:uncharacterized protein YkwD
VPLKAQKHLELIIILAAMVAALILPLGCEQYQAQPYPAQQYQVQPYPPQQYRAPQPWGPQAMAPGQPAARGTVHLQDVEERVWRLTNEIRQKQGFSPLSREQTLSGIAQAYCDDMLLRRFFSHINPEGLAAKDRVIPFYSRPIYQLGENIWMGSNLSPANSEALARSMMKSWMSSPGHRDNILCADFTHLGVGVAAVGREVRATQLFVNLRNN